MSRLGPWLRRNALALIALAVLIPVGVMATGVAAWTGAKSGSPVQPIEAGETAEFAGAQWRDPRVVDETSLHRDAVPPDARLLVAEFTVIPGGTGMGCTITLTEAEGAGRSWESQWNGAGLSWPEQPFCDMAATGPYEVRVPYFVPADAAERLHIDVVVADELPKFLRFMDER